MSYTSIGSSLKELDYIDCREPPSNHPIDIVRENNSFNSYHDSYRYAETGIIRLQDISVNQES
jgi:hypothetical protein